jgi:hypothetical protein
MFLILVALWLELRSRRHKLEAIIHEQMIVCFSTTVNTYKWCKDIPLSGIYHSTKELVIRYKRVSETCSASLKEWSE